LFVIAAIGWIDYVTGPDIGLSLIYLIPIAVSGWYLGVVPAVIVALGAAGSWITADIVWRADDATIAISGWNGFTRLVIYVSQGVMLAVLHHDRDELRRHAARQSALARTDHLTGLPNARSFTELLGREMSRARATGGAVCLLYADLDDFKTINDRYGHDAGDDVLRKTASILLKSIRGNDVAARLGGDEFAVMLTDASPDAAHAVGERIVMRIAAIGEDYPDAALGATAGVIHRQANLDSAEELIREADKLMYSGKEKGKGRVTLLAGDQKK
jgi:diguanylate cyclase (GGDEF)-like protein